VLSAVDLKVDAKLGLAILDEKFPTGIPSLQKTVARLIYGRARAERAVKRDSRVEIVYSVVHNLSRVRSGSICKIAQ
jgi:hypothetical protein